MSEDKDAGTESTPPPEKQEPHDPTKIQKYGLDTSKEKAINLGDKTTKRIQQT
jgi:hypothetical protein